MNDYGQGGIADTLTLPRGERLPFFSSICPCFQVLNFGNNILQFRVGAWCLSWTNVKLYWLI